jgi:hypothetical protein
MFFMDENETSLQRFKEQRLAELAQLRRLGMTVARRLPSVRDEETRRQAASLAHEIRQIFALEMELVGLPPAPERVREPQVAPDPAPAEPPGRLVIGPRIPEPHMNRTRGQDVRQNRPTLWGNPVANLNAPPNRR